MLSFDTVWRKVDPIIPQNVYHVAHRQREEAIAVHLIATNRLTMNIIPWLRSLRDTPNAYPSVFHICALDPLDAAPNPEHDIVVHTVENNIFAIEAQGDITYLRGDTGVFAGSSVGTALFNLAAWPVQQSWHNQRSEQGICEHLWLANPISGNVINIGCTFFADDSGSIVTGSSLPELVANDKKDDAMFNSCHAQAGLAQNVEKCVKV